MDIDFAIDELYSAGWWPRDADACARSSGGRWYPEASATEDAFKEAGWEVRLGPPGACGSIRSVWRGPEGVRGAAIASDPISARIMAFTALYRFKSARRSPVVDPRR